MAGVADVEELVSQLVQSAALAASAAPRDEATALKEVRLAAVRGRRGAELGRALPLPFLLDAGLVLKPEMAGQVSFREGFGSGRHRPVDYDTWLVRLRRRLGGWIEAAMEYDPGAGSPTPAGTSSSAADPLLPLLLDLLPPSGPARPEELTSYRDAYAALEWRTDSMRRVRDTWSEGSTPRAPGPARNATWFPVVPDRPGPAPAAAIMVSFAGEGHPDWIAEQLDHDAVQGYLGAPDASVVPDQDARVRRLQHRRNRVVEDPQTTGYEEPDRHSGAVALSVLAGGEYGMFLMQNGQAPRFGSVTSGLRPGPFEIHLCHAISEDALARARASLQRPHGMSGVVPSSPPGAAAGAFAGASALQATVALVLDHLRAALWPMDITFFVHRGAVDPMAWFSARPGERWGTAARSGAAPLPAGAAAALFKRRSWLEPAPLTWVRDVPGGPAGNGWWCLFLLEEDLPALGFRPRPVDASSASSEKRLPGWINESAPLAARFGHVIALDPAAAGGGVYRVAGGDGAYAQELRPVASRGGARWNGDAAHHRVRVHALDAALVALETRNPYYREPAPPAALSESAEETGGQRGHG